MRSSTTVVHQDGDAAVRIQLRIQLKRQIKSDRNAALESGALFSARSQRRQHPKLLFRMICHWVPPPASYRACIS
jgi:hypothetical protein